MSRGHVGPQRGGQHHVQGVRRDFSVAPVVVFWEVTRACALKCLHCRAEAQPYRHPLELSTQEGFRLLDQLATFRLPPIVILTGGDPFMRRDLFDLLVYGLECGLSMSVSPSATRMVTRDALARLRRLGISRISFSLDGASPEVHDGFRGVRGSYRLTLQKIEEALEVGLSLQVNTTVTRYNLGELPRIAELLTGYPDIVLWDVFFLVPTGRGLRDDVISPRQHEEAFNYLYDLGRVAPFSIKTTEGQHYRRVYFQRAVAEGKDPAEVTATLRRSATNDGKGVMFISHIGQVFPSGFLPVPCGDVRRRSPVAIYQESPVMRALQDPDGLKGKCGVCPFRRLCGGCRARAYAVTGDYLESEPFCLFDPSAWRGPVPVGGPQAKLPSRTARSTSSTDS